MITHINIEVCGKHDEYEVGGAYTIPPMGIDNEVVKDIHVYAEHNGMCVIINFVSSKSLTFQGLDINCIYTSTNT